MVGVQRAGMRLRNTTHLDSEGLERMLLEAVAGWPHHGLDVSVRYSRGAAFSGTCYYKQARIYVNLGRQNRYPFLISTSIARAESDRKHWWRELYSVEVAGARQLVLFVFMHEFYHWLVKKARRNVRQKESRCDRFATRALVDGYGAVVRNPVGGPVPRSSWDFQDLDGFVEAARRPGGRSRRGRGVGRDQPDILPAPDPGRQLMLFGAP